MAAIFRGPAARGRARESEPPAARIPAMKLRRDRVESEIGSVNAGPRGRPLVAPGRQVDQGEKFKHKELQFWNTMGRLPGGTMRRTLVLLIPLCLAAPAAPRQTAGEVQTTLPRLDAFEAPAAAREPIAIGGGRQLFIDRLLIARSEDLLLTVTAPERHPANPVLRPETPSDGQYLSVDSVWWNPERRIYQLWYSALHFEN